MEIRALKINDLPAVYSWYHNERSTKLPIDYLPEASRLYNRSSHRMFESTNTNIREVWLLG